MSLAKFVKHFVSSPSVTGSVAASSEGLSDLITDLAGLGGVSSVVELGPGTGAITGKIVQKISGTTKLLAIEINPAFAEEVRRKYPTAVVCCGSAVDVRRHLLEAGVGQTCDRIVCGLPWASFEERLQNDLLDSITTALNPGGILVSFAYLHGCLLPGGVRFRRMLFERFEKVTLTQTVWLNVPPAFVYRAEKGNAGYPPPGNQEPPQCPPP